MLIRKLLLSGILLMLAQSLKGVTLANDLPRVVSPNAQPTASPTDRPTAAPSPELQSFRNHLFSAAVLPLPPLIVPDLLLPPYNFPSFNSHRLNQELQLYAQYLRTFGTPDILIVGSSRSLEGIDPNALREALAARGYPGLKIFNFGINGGTARVNDLLLRQILTPEHLPRLIIWGDGARAFNEGRPDITYNGIVASAGYRRLQRGDRPIPARMTDWQVAKAATKTVVNHTAPEHIAPDLRPDGFQAVQQQFDPVMYHQRYPRVSGQFDSDYENFRLAGNQTAATIATARFAKAEGITLVFVNLPLTADYLDSIRQGYEQRFRQHMQQLAAKERFLFRDLSQNAELMKNEYFADPSHINRYGAEAIAFHLAADPGIPWAIVQKK